MGRFGTLPACTVCTHAYTHVCTHAYAHAYTDVCTHVYRPTCAHVCTPVAARAQRACLCTCLYTHPWTYCISIGLSGPPCPRTRLCYNGNPRLCIHTHTSVYGAHPKHLSKRIGYAACRLPQYLWSTRQRDGRATRRRAGHTPASTLPAVWHSLRCRRSGKRRVRAVCDPDPTIATLLK